MMSAVMGATRLGRPTACLTARLAACLIACDLLVRDCLIACDLLVRLGEDGGAGPALGPALGPAVRAARRAAAHGAMVRARGRGQALALGGEIARDEAARATGERQGR